MVLSNFLVINECAYSNAGSISVPSPIPCSVILLCDIKISNISPGLVEVRKHFLGGLYSGGGGLYSEGILC